MTIFFFFRILKMERNLINALGEPEQSNVIGFWRESREEHLCCCDYEPITSSKKNYNDRNLV